MSLLFPTWKILLCCLLQVDNCIDPWLHVELFNYCNPALHTWVRLLDCFFKQWISSGHNFLCRCSWAIDRCIACSWNCSNCLIMISLITVVCLIFILTATYFLWYNPVRWNIHVLSEIVHNSWSSSTYWKWSCFHYIHYLHDICITLFSLEF